MAGGVRKISAASARAHTRKHKQSSFQVPSGMFTKILVVLLVVIIAWSYQAMNPPPAKICGSPNGPPVTSSRIKLKDARHLAYKENGVPKEVARYKIIYIHGFDGCRHNILPLPKELAEELGIYLLSFDRAGYGESDPNPTRSEKSTAFDVEELADQLELGSKFYVIGFSMGGQAVWGCLKYIPHRLAGATLIAPVVNYWWPGFPANLSREAYYKQLAQDQWTLRVAHYVPWLTYLWNTQKWFPSSSVAAHSPDIYSHQDKEILPNILLAGRQHKEQIRQQGEFESLHRDLMIGFGSWVFDPMDLENPFANGKGSVHLWHGDEDKMVPVMLQRYIAQKLPWVRYHEVTGAGHMFPMISDMASTIMKTLLLGDGDQ